MKEFRHGFEVDVEYEPQPDYRFSVRITTGRKFQAYARDLKKKEDIPGPEFEYCLAAEDFAKAWREDYVKTKNIHCIEKAKV